MIAVLFARKDSIYKSLPECDVWDAERDARRPALPCIVTLTRLGGQALDQEDNLNIAFKGCRDELAAILGVNDRDPRVRWQYRHEPGGAVGIRIEIEEGA